MWTVCAACTVPSVGASACRARRTRTVNSDPGVTVEGISAASSAAVAAFTGSLSTFCPGGRTPVGGRAAVVGGGTMGGRDDGAVGGGGGCGGGGGGRTGASAIS